MPVLQPAVGLLGHTVVHDRAIGPSAADRLEGDVLQGIVLASTTLQPRHDLRFRQASRFLRIEPGQQFHHGRPVAQMRLRRALDFCGVLAGLGQGAGILAHLRPVAEGIGHDHRHALLVDEHRSAETGHMVQKPRRIVNGDLSPQMIAQFRQLCLRDEEIDLATVVQHGERLKDRNARNVRAAQVQQPADRIRQGDHRRLAALLREPFRQPRAFLRVRFARELDRMHPRGSHRRRRPVGPDPVNEVFGSLHRDAGALQRLLQVLELPRRVEPRIEADPTPLRQMLLQPRTGARVRPWHRGEVVRVDLRLDLRAVAPVDENARDARQARCRTRPSR